MTREAMDTFHRVLAKVGQDAVGLPLGVFDLQAFAFPLAKVHSEGRVSDATDKDGEMLGVGEEEGDVDTTSSECRIIIDALIVLLL